MSITIFLTSKKLLSFLIKAYKNKDLSQNELFNLLIKNGFKLEAQEIKSMGKQEFLDFLVNHVY